MKPLCVGMIFAGAGIMLYSILKYYRALLTLKARTQATRLFVSWIYAASLLMMLFFLVGYVVTAAIYTGDRAISAQDFLIAAIFFFGAVFVLAMVTVVRLMFDAISSTEALRREKELAEQASRAKGDFLSHMSHEMRTPMNAIIGMTRIGKAAGSLDKKNDCLDKIGAASSQLLGVINDVLDMSKIESGKFELNDAPFSLNGTLAGVVALSGFLMQEKHLRFTLDVGETVPDLLVADEQRLKQILTNLLGNAVKFTPEGGAVSLRVTRLPEDCSPVTLQFEVSDSGIGISPEQQKKLFRSFEQANAGIARKYGGTGLGLAISRHIVELMGGSIRVESDIGRGARFFFTMRAGEAQDVPSLPENAVPGADRFAGYRALIAEDIDINREIILALLEPTGLAVDCAADGREAVAMFSRRPDDYDIVFMDIHMPEVDGYAATRMIRNLGIGRAGTVPIVAMTADVFREDIRRCLEAGMNDHVGKPISLEEVLQKLRRYLSGRPGEAT